MTGSNPLHDEVKSALLARGIVSLDGLTAPHCQTGEEYTEISISLNDYDSLKKALIGAILAIWQGGTRCYWRVDTEYLVRGSHQAYARFIITDKPELDSYARVA